MELCVGAVSRRVIEEAATLKVSEIIASRRQVCTGGGYTGFDQKELVDLVRSLSSNATKIVRDHGGPGQGMYPASEDIGSSFEEVLADVGAGFDKIHWDVSKLDPAPSYISVQNFARTFKDVVMEVGGERESSSRNLSLALDALDEGACVDAVVLQAGGHIHEDRQVGYLVNPHDLEHSKWLAEAKDLRTKAHNFDWVGERHRFEDVIDLYNLAPELAEVEIDAWLTVLPERAARELLDLGLRAPQVERWFVGTNAPDFRRAKCGIRYILDTPRARNLLQGHDDTYVRERIQDAICAG